MSSKQTITTINLGYDDGESDNDENNDGVAQEKTVLRRDDGRRADSTNWHEFMKVAQDLTPEEKEVRIEEFS